MPLKSRMDQALKFRLLVAVDRGTLSEIPSCVSKADSFGKKLEKKGLSRTVGISNEASRSPLLKVILKV